MVESRISVGAFEKLPSTGRPDATISTWSCDMEGHAKKCVGRYLRTCEYNDSTANTKSQRHAWMAINPKKRKMRSVGELSTSLLTNCSQMSVSGSCWDTWHSDGLWTNLLVRYYEMDKSMWQTFGAFDHVHSSHKWIPTILSCRKHSTTMQIKIVSGFWFFWETLKSQNQHQEESLCMFGSHTVRPNKLDVQETNFSYTRFYRSWHNFFRCRLTHGWNSSSWSLGFGSGSVPFCTKPTQQHQRSCTEKTCRVTPHQTSTPKTKPRFQPSTTILIWTMLTVCHRTRSFSRFDAMLYIFEDSEAVIEMIIKGRSPTMRHVSRTHRVALDWLFDRINLDPKDSNQVCRHQTPTYRHVDTREFHTRWVKQSSLSVLDQPFQPSLSAAPQNFSFTNCTKTMAKRMQVAGRRQQNRGKVKNDDEPGLPVSTSSSTVQSTIASKSLVILEAPCRRDWSGTGKPDARDRNHDAASSSQGWQKDAFLDVSTGRHVATKEDQEHPNYPEDSESTRKLDAPDNPGNSGDSGTEGSDEDWPHNLHKTTNYVLHMEKVFSIVRQRYGV